MMSRLKLARSALAAARGNDVVDVLKGQHAQIRRSFRRAALPEPVRTGAFRDLVRLLSVHEAAEEAHIHPLTRRIAGKAVAGARHAEEEEAKKLLVSLQRTGPHGDGYRRALSTLRRAVLAHAAREEREEFPALLRRVSLLRRRILGAEVQLAQVIAPTRPHPRVNGALANRLALPLLGPLDRAKDRLAARQVRTGCTRSRPYGKSCHGRRRDRTTA